MDRVTPKRCAQRSARAIGRRRYNREVRSLDPAGLAAAFRRKLRGQRGMRSIRFRRNHDARGAFVEPVHNAWPSHPADPRKIRAMIQQRVDQRACRVAGRRMNDHAGWLVDHDDFAVLEQDDEGNGLRNNFEWLGGRNLQLDAVADANLFTGLGRDHAIVNHPSLLDQSLHMGPRQRCQRVRRCLSHNRIESPRFGRDDPVTLVRSLALVVYIALEVVIAAAVRI